jgi:endogenous inhibitor of DNA gyrase (YacG/DUF329 family)
VAARKCPICGKTAVSAPEDVLPFCSPTCKLVDLGRWLDGSYRVPGPPLEIENDAHEIPTSTGTEER